MKSILNMKPITTALLLAMLFAAEVHAQPFSDTLTLPWRVKGQVHEPPCVMSSRMNPTYPLTL